MRSISRLIQNKASILSTVGGCRKATSNGVTSAVKMSAEEVKPSHLPTSLDLRGSMTHHAFSLSASRFSRNAASRKDVSWWLLSRASSASDSSSSLRGATVLLPEQMAVTTWRRSCSRMVVLRRAKTRSDTRSAERTTERSWTSAHRREGCARRADGAIRSVNERGATVVSQSHVPSVSRNVFTVPGRCPTYRPFPERNSQKNFSGGHGGGTDS
eukprot:7379394-Prymnesium_polylepis.1